VLLEQGLVEEPVLIAYIESHFNSGRFFKTHVPENVRRS
jgi:hypothetical protein